MTTIFRKGMQVIVASCDSTKDYYGWDEDMNKYIGKICIITQEPNNGRIILDNDTFHWHPDDLDILPGITDPVPLKGKKQHFDINELV
jgi:hypothetical protein